MIDEETNDLAVQYALGILPRKQVPDFESQLRSTQNCRIWSVTFSVSMNGMQRSRRRWMLPIDGYSRILEQIDRRARLHPKRTRTNIVPFLGWAGWGLAACFAAAFFMVRSSGPPEIM